MGLQMNTGNHPNPEIVYRSNSAYEAEDLRYSLKQVFPELDFSVHLQSLSVFAKQGVEQSMKDYLNEREQVRYWLSRLPEEGNSTKTKAHQLANIMLSEMKEQLSDDHPLLEDIQAKQGLLNELQQLKNNPGFWLVCRQILELEHQVKNN